MGEKRVFYIALGSNIGDRHQYLSDARRAIGSLPSTSCIAETAVEETEPIGPIAQESFLNQMVAVRTTLSPDELLSELQKIEHDAGRKRNERWGPRTLDLDIVAMEGAAISSPSLVVPHPELPNRDFWISELAYLRRNLREGD